MDQPLDGVFHDDRKFLRTLAQLARLDPRIRAIEDESDLVQDTLARAMETYGKKLTKMKPAERRALLRKTLNTALVDLVRFHHQQCRDVDRAEAARAHVEESSVAWEKNVAGNELNPEEACEREERFARLAVAVQSLPYKERVVIQTKFFLNLPLSEVSEHIGMKQTQVAGYYTRGLKRLKQVLKDLESQHE